MLHLLQPSWLTATAAIAIPIALHFWNDRRGKVVRIGSIALLTMASRRMAWSRRLSQVLLLLLRCLLLLALALLLARPCWQRKNTIAGKKGWLLEAGRPDAATERAPAAYRLLIDSLVKAGFEKHVLSDSTNYWNGFRMADRIAPAGEPFYIFTTGLAGRFSGERPVTEREVRWYTYLPPDSVSHWTQDAWLSSKDTMQLLKGESRSTGSLYRVQTLAMGKQTLATGENQPSIKADTTTWHITIYTDAIYRQDSRYVAAAIRALQIFTRHRIEISVTGSLPSTRSVVSDPVEGSNSWLFWLSVRPLPAATGFAHILQYEQGKEKTVNTRVEGIEWMKEVDEADADSGAAGQKSGSQQNVIWRDGYGRGVLELEEAPGKRVYHFFSRFDPDWNGLVWSSSFPVLLEGLLFKEAHEKGVELAMTEDRRVLDSIQILPVRRAWPAREATEGNRSFLPAPAGMEGTESHDQDSGGVIDLAPAIWLLVFLLFILERIVSYSISPGKKDG